MDLPLHCICCEKSLQAPFPDAPYQPNDGIMCSSYGNYGSTVFDPIAEPAELFFVLCDECLSKKQKLVHVFIEGAKVAISGPEYFQDKTGTST